MATERLFYEHMSGERMYATGGLPSHTAGYIDITLHSDVWFLLLTVSGVLVCFVAVGGRLTGCRVSPPRFTHVCVGSRSSFGGHLSQCSFER